MMRRSQQPLSRKRETLKNLLQNPRLIFLPFITICFVNIAFSQPSRKDEKAEVLSIVYYIESANNSVNSLAGLLRKDNYRNKITRLNNPVNNELGFSLKNEIVLALKPILDKTKKTDTNKFRDVIENFLNNPEDNGIKSVKKHLPALGIFSTVLSLVGNLVINERAITREDLNKFMERIGLYFYQYEKLNAINDAFSYRVQALLERTDDIKNDIRDFLVECITTIHPTVSRLSLKDTPVEMLLQKHYDPQKLMEWLDTCGARASNFYPPDAATSVKVITAVIKKLQKEFESLYNENYTELKDLIANLKQTIPNLDQDQLNRTSGEIESLYKESRQADQVNLNIILVDERMHTVCRLINN